MNGMARNGESVYTTLLSCSAERRREVSDNLGYRKGFIVAAANSCLCFSSLLNFLKRIILNSLSAFHFFRVSYWSFISFLW